MISFIQVNCLGEHCGGLWQLVADAKHPYHPASANQIYRWLFSVFLHRGVFELACLLNIQVTVLSNTQAVWCAMYKVPPLLMHGSTRQRYALCWQPTPKCHSCGSVEEKKLIRPSKLSVVRHSFLWYYLMLHVM